MFTASSIFINRSRFVSNLELPEHFIHTSSSFFWPVIPIKAEARVYVYAWLCKIIVYMCVTRPKVSEAVSGFLRSDTLQSYIFNYFFTTFIHASCETFISF